MPSVVDRRDFLKTTGGTYDVEDYGVYDLPVSPEFAKLIK